MRNFKRFLTLVLAALMLVSTFAVSTSAAFTDVAADNKALTRAVNLLSYLNVTKGTTETTFSPDTLVTREQMAAFIYRLMKAGKSVEGGANTSGFADLEDPTFYYMVSWAASQKIINGVSATKFNPKGNITLQDAYTMIVRALGYEKKEALPYPFGYIDMAEELKLDKNLPSTLTYVDALSRGDVAILLYNTFFAEMYDEEIAYVTEQKDTDNDGVLETVITPVEEYQTVAEKVFEVEKKYDLVVATPHYFFNNAKIDAEFDVEVVRFASENYCTFEELDLTGKADDYFLSGFNLYIKDFVNEDDEAERVILYAEPLLKKKTAVRAELELLPDNKKDGNYYGTYSYNTNGDDKFLKPSGKITIDGQVTYMWDAPYTFASPKLTGNETTDTYYQKVNAKNVEFIGLNLVDDDDAYEFVSGPVTGIDSVMEMVEVDPDGVPASDDEYYRYTADTFAEAMSDLYFNGYYEIDTWDCNGDDKIDYAWYKPYTFGKLVNDEDTPIGDHETEQAPYQAVYGGVTNNIPTIYTYDATVEGDYSKNDFALAYVNAPAEYVKVAKIIPGVKSAISHNANDWSFYLKNGDFVQLGDVSQKVYGFWSADIGDLAGANAIITRNDTYHYPNYRNFTTSDALWDVERMFYVVDGKLLFTDASVAGKWNADEDISVVTEQYSEAVRSYIGGKYQSIPFLKLWSFGFSTKKAESHPVDTGAFLVGETLTGRYEIAETATAGVYDFANYVDELVISKVDEDGYYSFKLVANEAGSDDDVLAGEEDGASYYEVLGDGYTLERVDNKTYRLKDASGNNAIAYTDAEGDAQTVKYLKIDDGTKIIINENGKFNQYSLTKAYRNDTTILNDVRVVITNNASTKSSETLAVLYAKTSSIVADSPEMFVDTFAIVSKFQGIVQNDNGLWQAKYSVLNPNTGAVESVLTSVADKKTVAFDKFTSAAIPVGSLVSVVDGELMVSDINDVAGAVLDTVFTDGAYTVAANTNIYRLLSHEGNEIEFDGVGPALGGKTLKTNSDTKVAWLKMNSATVSDGATIEVASLEDLNSDANKFKNFAWVQKDPVNKPDLLKQEYEDLKEIYFTMDADYSHNEYELANFILIITREFTDTQFADRAIELQ